MTSTIKDVAKYANVSVATVSRVINNTSKVSDITKQRVEDAIIACNFIPNTIAQNLKKEISKNIGFVISDISNPYYMNIAKVLESSFRSAGYTIMICSTEECKEQELACIKQLLSNKVAGIILNTTGQNDDYIVNLSTKIPIVLLERQIQSKSFVGDFVGSDNYGGMHTLTQALLDAGHRHIGFINGNLSVSTANVRYRSFIDTLNSNNITWADSLHYNLESFSEQNGFSAIHQLMSINEPPTAILAANNSLAIGALKYLKANEIIIPDAISFASYGSLENVELFFNETSRVYYDPAQIASRILHFIFSRLESNVSIPSRESVLHPEFKQGNGIKNVN